MIAYTYPKSVAEGDNNNKGLLGKQPAYPSMSSADESDHLASHGPYKSALIRRFDFSSQLQRMSTICKSEFDQEYRAFVKGSPEKIMELCNNESLPQDY